MFALLEILRALKTDFFKFKGAFSLTCNIERANPTNFEGVIKKLSDLNLKWLTMKYSLSIIIDFE